MGEVIFRIEGLSICYGSRLAVDGLTVNVDRGTWLGILGPNGSGKSTLLRCLGRALRPQAGMVWFEGVPLYSMRPEQAARRLAVVSQDNPLEFGFTVEEVVGMGRYPHLRPLQGETARDMAVVKRAMADTNTLPLGGRRYTELSGGERQRVVIARALAQEPSVLLLDEPISSLDIGHQVEILDLIQRQNRATGMTVVMAIHDLNLAGRYCRELVLMKDGRVWTAGRPEEVLTAGNIREVYGSEVVVRWHPLHGVQVVPGLAPRRQGGAGSGKRVHVVGGGGSGQALMEFLYTEGFEVSAGVLNVGDSDWEAARLLGIRFVEAPPFSPITAENSKDNLALMLEAGAVIMANVPFGHGNLANLDALRLALEAGKNVILLGGRTLEGRDYTSGVADARYRMLIAGGAIPAGSLEDAHRMIHDVLSNNNG